MGRINDGKDSVGVSARYGLMPTGLGWILWARGERGLIREGGVSGWQGQRYRELKRDFDRGKNRKRGRRNPLEEEGTLY